MWFIFERFCCTSMLMLLCSVLLTVRLCSGPPQRVIRSGMGRRAVMSLLSWAYDYLWFVDLFSPISPKLPQIIVPCHVNLNFWPKKLFLCKYISLCDAEQSNTSNMCRATVMVTNQFSWKKNASEMHFTHKASMPQNFHATSCYAVGTEIFR